MIDTIIFDFGDVLINLNHQKSRNELQKIGLSITNQKVGHLNQQFELGNITETAFLLGLQQESSITNINQIKTAWQTIIGNFPQYRLDFLVQLSQKYKLCLLSNTDQIHIRYFEQKVGAAFAKIFYSCFSKVYFSFDLHLRKPDLRVYQKVLLDIDRNPNQVLFVDDKSQNTQAATSLDIAVWNLQVGHDDVVDLLEKNINLL